MNKEEKYISYLVDLILIIQEKRQQIYNDSVEDIYINGQLQGYNNSLDYMKKLAIENELPVKILGLDIPIQYRIDNHELKNEDYKKYIEYIPLLTTYILQELFNSKQSNDLMSQGKLFAYYDILTIMKEQAELAFQIDIEEIGLKDKNIEELVFA